MKLVDSAQVHINCTCTSPRTSDFSASSDPASSVESDLSLGEKFSVRLVSLLPIDITAHELHKIEFHKILCRVHRVLTTRDLAHVWRASPEIIVISIIALDYEFHACNICQA